MAKETKASHLKPGEAEKEHRVRHQESQSSVDKLHGWESNKFPLGETPFLPQMDEHAALLRAAHSDEGRTNLLLHLQRTYGNTYVQRLLNSKKVQAKLTVNAPGDIYEQEADRVAEAVTEAVTSQTQRQEEEEEEVQTQAVEEEEEEVQVQSAENKPTKVSENLETRINKARGGGHPLSDEVREPMGKVFGTDFKDVRVHTDSEANLLNQQLSATAFTTARDIFFRQGEYSPGSDSGKKLIAHELTHVVQQSNGQIRGAGGAMVHPSGETFKGDEEAKNGLEIQRSFTVGGEELKQEELGLKEEGALMAAFYTRGWSEIYDAIWENEKISFEAASWDELIAGIKEVDGPYDKMVAPLLIGGAEERRGGEEKQEIVEGEKVRESQVKKVASGGTIAYSSLSAGCMAVTVIFRNGGGVGVHLALNEDQVRPWWEFQSLVGKGEIDRVEIDLDLGVTTGGQGWWVRYKDGSTPDIFQTPRSRSWLLKTYKFDLERRPERTTIENIFNQKGWFCEYKALEDWFKSKFRVSPDINPETNPEPKTL